ncbi:MAG: dihydrofolate reductase family protein [Anaerolineae bacterium]
MRKVIASLFISTDGVVEAPERWQFDYSDPDLLHAMTSAISVEDTVLLGRVTYQEWAGYWPNATDDPYASHINHAAKYVVSTTLDQAPWGRFEGATVVRDDLDTLIERLRQEPGQNIGVAGSPSLVRSLLDANLLDELTLIIIPAVAGSGKRLFHDGDSPRVMKLVYAKQLGSGAMILTYQPAPAGERLQDRVTTVADQREGSLSR